MNEIQFLMYESDEKIEVVVSILENTTQHGAIEGKMQTKDVKFYNLDAIQKRLVNIKNSTNIKKSSLILTGRLKRYKESRNE